MRIVWQICDSEEVKISEEGQILLSDEKEKQSTVSNIIIIILLYANRGCYAEFVVYFGALKTYRHQCRAVLPSLCRCDGVPCCLLCMLAPKRDTCAHVREEHEQISALHFV